MSDSVTLATSILEIAGILFGLLFIVFQLVIRQNDSIRPDILIEIVKSILTGMLILSLSAVVATWVLFQESNPNLAFAAGLFILVFIILIYSSILVVSSMRKGTLKEE